MRRLWSTDELAERWSLEPGDEALLVGLPDAGRLGLVAQLSFWRCHGAFPDEEADLAPAVIAHLARETGVRPEVLDGYDWAGRTGRRHRRAILDHLAVSPFDAGAEADLRTWLSDEALPCEPSSTMLEERIGAWFARHRVVRPKAWRLDRIVRSARAAHDDAALDRVASCLDPATCERLDGLLADNGGGTSFTRLSGDPGRVGLESLMTELGKLELVRALALPSGLLDGLHQDLVQRFRRRGRRRDGMGAAPPSRPHPPAASGLLLRAARGGARRWSHRASHPDHATHHSQGREAGDGGVARGRDAGSRQGRHPVRHRPRRPGRSRRCRSRRHLPGGGQNHVREAGEGGDDG